MDVAISPTPASAAMAQATTEPATEATTSEQLQSLLQRPEVLLAPGLAPAESRRIAGLCLVVIAVGGALFGAAVGWYRGAPQALAAAVKLPLVTLATIVLCAPALVSLRTLVGHPQRWRHTILALLVAAARTSLLLAAWAPLLWLGIELGLGYHSVKLWAAAAYGIAGLSALGLIVRPFRGQVGGTWARLGVVLIFGLVGLQCAWLLRPYIGSPNDAQVPFVVNRNEGGLPGAMWRSVQRISEAAR